MLDTWLLGVDEVSMMTVEQLSMLSKVSQFVVHSFVIKADVILRS
jgi:hypothetical protein